MQLSAIERFTPLESAKKAVLVMGLTIRVFDFIIKGNLILPRINLVVGRCLCAKRGMDVPSVLMDANLSIHIQRYFVL